MSDPTTPELIQSRFPPLEGRTVDPTAPDPLTELRESIREFRSHRGRNGPMHLYLDIEEAEALAATIERLEGEVERLRGVVWNHEDLARVILEQQATINRLEEGK